MSDNHLRDLFESIDPARQVSDDCLDDLLPTDRLLERVSAEMIKRRGWRYVRNWKRVGVITTSVVLVFSGAAVALSLLRSPVQNTTQLTCFSSATQDSSATVVSLSAHPLRTCETLMHWSHQSKGTQPAGVLCILSNGSIGGFPFSQKSDECRALGLSTYSGRVTSPRAAAFQEAAQNYFATHHCQSLSTAHATVDRLLRVHKVVGWHVHVSGSTSPAACATLAVQAKDKIVDIVGIKF
jgi:hypothetical protein